MSKKDESDTISKIIKIIKELKEGAPNNPYINAAIVEIIREGIQKISGG